MCSVLTDPKTANIRPINTVHQEETVAKVFSEKMELQVPHLK